jgi:hypothetical protein
VVSDWEIVELWNSRLLFYESFCKSNISTPREIERGQDACEKILRREGIFIVCFEREVTSLFKKLAHLFSHHEIFPDYPIFLINPGAELQLNFDNVVIVF